MFSDEAEIHISVAPAYIERVMVASSPVPSSWKVESPQFARHFDPRPMIYGMDSVPPASTTSQSFPSAMKKIGSVVTSAR